MELVQIVANLQTTTAICATVLIFIAAFVTAFSFAFLGSKFFESVVRQPELAQMLLLRMFLLAGLIDAFAAISAATGLLLFFGKNPFLTAVLSAAVQRIG